jgi:dTDP-glucose 4,6-dehydratase
MMLVVGGAGFIGSAFVRLVGGATVFDALTYAGRTENLEGVDHVFIKGDVRSPRFLEVATQLRPRYVVNFAAQTHVDRSIADPQQFVATNVMGTLNVLEAARKLDFRYIHISTDEVYGEQEATEDTPLNPSSPYSASKAAADLLVKAYVRTYGVDAFIVRPSNNFGPRQYPEKFVPKAIIRTLMGQHVPVYGDGKQERDWIYVDDTARVIHQLLEKGRKGEAYNVPGHHRVTNLKMLELIGQALGKTPKIRFVADRPGHDKTYRMTNTKLEYSVTPLSEAVKATVQWYVENSAWWRPLIQDRFYVDDEPWGAAPPTK